MSYITEKERQWEMGYGRGYKEGTIVGALYGMFVALAIQATQNCLAKN